jgi:hypothetical protein
LPARCFQLAVDAPQLVVHPVHVRTERAELVAVRQIESPREVAGGDLGEARLRALDRADQRPREDEAEAEGERDADPTDADEEVARGRVRAAIRSDQGPRLRAGPLREVVGCVEEILVCADRFFQRRSRLVAGGACAVELGDGGQRTIERVIVAPDSTEH